MTSTSSTGQVAQESVAFQMRKPRRMVDRVPRPNQRRAHPTTPILKRTKPAAPIAARVPSSRYDA